MKSVFIENKIGIENYFTGVVEQVYGRLGKLNQNIVMVQYSNDFSIEDQELEKKTASAADSVYFAWHEFKYNEIACGYAPFLDIICDMFRRYGTGSFDAFMSECGVYVPHQEILKSYYETGCCSRTEMVLLDEVEYEQKRMVEGIAAMLLAVSSCCPVVIVINRFQLASRSAMKLVCELLQISSSDIGMVLAVNGRPMRTEGISEYWETIVEKMEDGSNIYHIGNGEKRREGRPDEDGGDHREFQSVFQDISNTIELLDYNQAEEFFQDIFHRIKFEGEEISDDEKLQIYPLYARTSILKGDFPKALELIGDMAELQIAGKDRQIRFAGEYYLAMCQMYQGKLGESFDHAQRAKELAEEMGDSRRQLEAELLSVEAQMSGWHNLLFCLRDIEISEEFLERLKRYGYRNYLAHIYTYAFDNEPDVVKEAYESEFLLNYFSKGIALAREIGNEYLIHNAYQKNVMISATYGANEIAIMYLMKIFQMEKGRVSLECGRTYSALGYNFSAFGRYDLAVSYYQHALKLFYQLRLPVEIAEVHYNMALNCIMHNDFVKSGYYLQLCMKTIEKLHLNGLRVCTLSKLYGLQALISILQNDGFNCQRYLLNSSQFLNYVMDRQGSKIETNHDYAQFDEEFFLCWFCRALLAKATGDYETAQENFAQAEQFMMKARSNTYYAYPLFCRNRMELFQIMGKTEQYEAEKAAMEAYCRKRENVLERIPKWVFEEVGLQDNPEETLRDSQLVTLVKQENQTRKIRDSRKQMEYLFSWQKLIDVNDLDAATMVSNAIRSFLYQFGNDHALYVRYDGGNPRVLYNDTGVELTREQALAIGKVLKQDPQGFAVSKISGNFVEHRDIISFFGEDDVCSLAAVPFFKNGKIESVIITYILMKDNWHTSAESYMISEEDLLVYQLLFREMSYSINRLEAYEKIYEMNQKLNHAAKTDTLTGIQNRNGLYQELEVLTERLKREGRKCSLGVMFIDLDNFKPYNDTFGHNVGDVILTSMARIFCEVTKGRGIVCRYGGDEFLIILEDYGRDAIEELARSIYRKLEEAHGFADEVIRIMGNEVVLDPQQQITCSIGIAMSDGISEEQDINRLIKCADDVLHSIKEGEKGMYALWDGGKSAE